MGQLDKLIRRRAYVKGRVIILRRLEEYNATENKVSEIEVMLNALECYRLEFKELQEKIEDCLGISIDEQQAEREECDDNIITTEANLRER